MKITVKLIANYREKLPPDAKGNSCTLEIPKGSSIEVVLDHFDIANDSSNVILVNGHSHDHPPTLREGDVVTVFSAIAGG